MRWRQTHIHADAHNGSIDVDILYAMCIVHMNRVILIDDDEFMIVIYVYFVVVFCSSFWCVHNEFNLCTFDIYFDEEENEIRKKGTGNTILNAN